MDRVLCLERKHLPRFLVNVLRAFLVCLLGTRLAAICLSLFRLQNIPQQSNTISLHLSITLSDVLGH